jgi:hypothetical protein
MMTDWKLREEGGERRVVSWVPGGDHRSYIDCDATRVRSATVLAGTLAFAMQSTAGVDVVDYRFTPV